jgi:hypothetical protein
MEAERIRYPGMNDQLYIYRDEHGNFYNKYFPGVALLQLPFFGIACVVSWIFAYPIDGYNDIFNLFYYLGGLFYGLMGMFLFVKCLKAIFSGNDRLIEWFVPIFYCASPLLFYCFDSPELSHNYSFFLFGLFSLLVLRMRKTQRLKDVMLLGGIIGLIVLVRPTNGLIILMISYLFIDFKSFKLFTTHLFKNKAVQLFGFIVVFFSVILVQFIFWKWQSGDWFKWSYNGEGFNFLQPQFLTGFFSFRIGLFLHIPLLFFSFLGVMSIVRTNPFQAISIILYFFAVSWVILSWWCWDYESNFGPRPFSEHLFFFFIPVIHFALKYPKWMVVTGIAIVTLNGAIRYWESRTDFVHFQRFTKYNFFQSLKFWETRNNGRWNFTRSTVPHGKLITRDLLLSRPYVNRINKDSVYTYVGDKTIKNPRTNERLYYRVRLNKKQQKEKFENVFLVIDAYNEGYKKRNYTTIEIFNDRFEGQKNWANLEFEGQIYDNLQEYEFIKIYIWNQRGKTFWLKDVEIILDTYKN